MNRRQQIVMFTRCRCSDDDLAFPGTGFIGIAEKGMYLLRWRLLVTLLVTPFYLLSLIAN